MSWRARARVAGGPTLVTALVLLSASRAGAQMVFGDSFDAPPPAWAAHPADGVSLRIGSGPGRRGRAMRLDFDFHGHGGYAIARRTFATPLTLPENYAVTFWVRGHAPVEALELKLIDSAGENVWWHVRREFQVPERWTRLVSTKRRITFAWGPGGGGELHRLGAIEIVITAGQGGRGTLWVDDVALTAREPVRPYDLVPRLAASTAMPGAPPSRAMDGDTATAWHSAPSPTRQLLTVDFGRARNFGGIIIQWAAGEYAIDYLVQTSADGDRWETAWVARGSGGGRDPIPIPDGEARWLRLVLERPHGTRGYGIRELLVQPLEFGDSPNAFVTAEAAAAPRGWYPRAFRREQTYWTIVGADGGMREALLDTDGRVETGARFSIEPFLFTRGRLVTWADVEARPSLEEGELPIPSVEWHTGTLALTLTAFADGARGASALVVRYRVANRGDHPSAVTLFLAVRPYQVNPPWQFLNVPGGVIPIHAIRIADRMLRVDSECVRFSDRPQRAGASTLDAGGIMPSVAAGHVPSARAVRDPHGYAAAVVAYPLVLAAGATREVSVEVPLGARTRWARLDSAAVARRLAAAASWWQRRLGAVSLELPTAAADVARTVRTSLAYILIERDGPRLRPGTRAYSRSWIRDGALESAALLRLGLPDVARDFIEWFATYQYPNGKVPCCVDAHGADPVPENDSHGELIFAIVNYWRFTHDTAFLTRMWPHIASAATYIDSLRHERMTAEYDTSSRRVFYGLLPQSISHEGYSAKPMHSYWDDLFALRGLMDAADAAHALGHTRDAARLDSVRDEFRRDLAASVRLAIAAHHIDYIPGSAELGDFDATSTTIAGDPVDALSLLPDRALRNTFERFWREVHARRDSTGWDAYTPYELRTVGTFVRLGWADRAIALLDGYLDDQRPPAWHQWPEVITRDPREPRFIGDMPHGWVASDFLRSALDLLAYDRGADSALMIAAGVPDEWITTPPGVLLRGLVTPHGRLDLALSGTADTILVRVGGELRVPRGGIVIQPARRAPIRSASVDGVPAPVDSSAAVRVTHVPAVVVLRYR